MFKKISILFFFAVAFLSVSCSEYQKVLKSEDTKLKYDMAEKLYNEGKYQKALAIFDQIVPSYIGKPQGERIIFFYANAYYQVKDYYLAAYQFERFTKSYPRSEKVEEALFLGAKSQYYISPKYSIDQKETVKAIDRLQTYINTYPNSERAEEANFLFQELRAKLEKKAYEIAKQYNHVQDYKAAVTASDVFLSEYPGSVYREDALYNKFFASYSIAINSVADKMEERLNDAKASYNTLTRYFPENKYKKEADEMLATIDRELQQFSK